MQHTVDETQYPQPAFAVVLAYIFAADGARHVDIGEALEADPALLEVPGILCCVELKDYDYIVNIFK